MSPALNPPARPHQIHVRATPALRQQVRAAARAMHLPISAAVGVLVEEALRVRREKAEIGPSNPEELQLHVLVAVEQLIALIESIHPKGPGIAQAMLPQALKAATKRVTVGDEPRASESD